MIMPFRYYIRHNGINCIRYNPYTLLTVETDYGTYYPGDSDGSYYFRDKDTGNVLTVFENEYCLEDCYIYGDYLLYTVKSGLLTDDGEFRCVDRNGNIYKGFIHDGLYIFKDNSLVLLSKHNETIARVFDSNTTDVEFTENDIIATVDNAKCPLPMYVIYEYNGNKNFELSNEMNERNVLEYFTYLFLESDKLSGNKEMAGFVQDIKYKAFYNQFEYIEAIGTACVEVNYLSEQSYREYRNLKDFFEKHGLTPSLNMLISITYANVKLLDNLAERKVFFCSDIAMKRLENLINQNGMILFLQICSDYKELCNRILKSDEV